MYTWVLRVLAVCSMRVITAKQSTAHNNGNSIRSTWGRILPILALSSRITASTDSTPAVSNPEILGVQAVQMNRIRNTASTLADSSSVCFSHPIYYSPFFSLSPLVVIQIRGHIVGSSPPSLIWFVPCFFIARNFSSFFPRRLASNCAYPRYRRFQQLILFYFANKLKIPPRRDSKSRTNASSIRG